jgi:hypothetical protein
LEEEATKRVPRAKVILGAAAGGTQEISLDQILEEFEATADGLGPVRTPTDVQRPPSSTEELSLDRFIAADNISEEEISLADITFGDELDENQATDPLRRLANQRARESGLDPRLVRAAMATVVPVTVDLDEDEGDDEDEVSTLGEGMNVALVDTVPRIASDASAKPIPIPAALPRLPPAPSAAAVERPHTEVEVVEPIAPAPDELAHEGEDSPGHRDSADVIRPSLPMAPPRFAAKSSTQREPLRLILLAILLGTVILGGSLWLRDSWDTPYDLTGVGSGSTD